MLTRGKKKATLSDPSELVFEDGAPCFRSSGVINLQSIYRFLKEPTVAFVYDRRTLSFVELNAS